MTYVKPGVYISEKFGVGGVVTGGFVVPCLVGVGSTYKRYWDEEIVKGKYKQIIVVGANGVATLSYKSTQKKYDCALYKNGQKMPDDAYNFTNETTITIQEAYRDTSATWEFEYLAVNKDFDSLANDAEKLQYVSKTAGGGRPYRLGIDYNWDKSVDKKKIDWSVLTAATVTGVSGPFNLSTNNKIKISVDGKSPIEVVITGANQSAVTAAEVVEDINSAAGTAWGTSYNSIASVSTNKVVITSVLKGVSGRINFYTPSSADATNTIFGIVPPAYFLGTGEAPQLGQTYYVTYDAVRPSEDYNVVKMYFSYDSVFKDIGPVTRNNDLMVAAELAFLNGVQQLGVVQVKDSDGDGIYMYGDWVAALNAIKESREVTDLVLLNADEDVMSYAVGVIEEESGLYRGHWMGGWFGVGLDTPIGDPDVAGSIVYTAARTLQVSANSPARGRMILVAPPNAKYTLTETDTRITVEKELESYFLAAALAGMLAGLDIVSDSLLRRRVVGITASSLTLTESEASYLASHGVTPIINSGGVASVFDYITTDTIDELYSEPNIRVQKDYLAKRIRDRLDAYMIGITPDNLDEFIHELKAQIAIEIEAAISDKIIAPFRTDSGVPRALDLANDIKVFRSQVKKTEYRFVYWFQAKWTVKRIFGEYWVDTALLG